MQLLQSAIILWLATFCVQAAVPANPAPLAYDPAAYELAPELRAASPRWTRADLRQELLSRIQLEKQRRELEVYYYRIGFTMSYPLALDHRPTTAEMPAPIPNLAYPWMVWLSWAREERWRLLQAGWRDYKDTEAGELLQRELAALSRWDCFCESDGKVGLLTGHTAASLAVALANTNRWQAGLLSQARAAAEALIERDVWPWFLKNWPEEELTPRKLVNIPVIALARSAQLARVIGSPRLEALDQKTGAVLRTWSKFRVGPEHHTEGVTYDGYLLDAITEWIAGLPDRDAVLKENQAAFRTLTEQWLALTLPGRTDLHAPLADVEPEMTFWATVLVRLASWYDFPEAIWLAQRLPLARLRAPALLALLADKPLEAATPPTPEVRSRELTYALSLRTGWTPDDLLAAVGLSRGVMGHLQADSGQLVLAWHGRCWIADPGYQQYRPGDERDYTLGPEAHNAPVIGGVFQTLREARLERCDIDPQGRQHVRIDLTACYRGLPAGAQVKREIWLLNPGAAGVVIRDSFKALGQNAEVAYFWHGGNHLGWSFADGWGRLSDGERALWMGTLAGPLAPAELKRHPGTRGTLTLSHSIKLPDGGGECWWVFLCDPQPTWTTPTALLQKGILHVERGTSAARSGWDIGQ